MANTRVEMRRIREVFRLRERGLSRRAVSRSLDLSPATVMEYLRRAAACGLDAAQAANLDDTALERRLYPPPLAGSKATPWPDYAAVHQELKGKGVTLALLWEEYKAQHPDGLQYSAFCRHYRHHAARVDLSMRQVHRAGEKCFVDYAGQTVPVVDRSTGERREAQIFVAVLGASNYTYAEASWTQSLADWIGSHIRAFEYFQCVPHLLVPDNLKSGVRRAHRYEPLINQTYQEMAAHYGTAVLPARAARPKDKAKVEVGVQIVERFILARLRHHTFFSLAELNAAIAELRERLNTRAFRKLPGTRRTQFEALDRPAMRGLAAERYVFAEWKRARVHVDYHIEVNGHYYSVPYALVGVQLEVRLTAHTLEVFHRGQRVASHPRSHQRGRHTTVTEHMPQAHRHYAEWTPQRLLAWAQKTGPATAQLIESILATRAHPQQGFRSCLGIMRLGQRYGQERLEAACERALKLGAQSYRSLESILRQGIERQPLPDSTAATATVITHENLRGTQYYY